jgi:hypothetical protein
MTHPLKQINDRLPKIIQLIKWDIRSVPSNAGLSIMINTQTVRTAIEDVEEFGLLPELTKKLKGSVLFSTGNNDVKADNASINEVIGMLTSFKETLSSLSTTINLLVPEESPNSINVKLPPVNDFNDLAQYAKDFHLALTQVLLLEEINEGVKIESVENGSIWLNVMLYSSVGLTVVGRLVWAGAIACKKILELKKMEQDLRALTIKTDSLEDIMKAQKESLGQLIQAEAEHINSETFKENVPENIERIKHSIRLFGDLLSKGAEVHPAIEASEATIKEFPDMKALMNVQSKINQISQ